ncbi:MAG: DUF1697 domain-containing protein [bacterium]
MSIYVALLRGINVGGNNIIKMEDLRDTIAQAGFQSVKTYIQSGNVIFQSEITQKNIIEKNLEKLLSSRFHYTAKVLVRSKKDMQDTINHLPKIFENEERKHNVIFLSDQIDSKNILTKFEIKKDIEEISYHP